MAAQWTPPADGTPCWIDVRACDVPRGLYLNVQTSSHLLKVLPLDSSAVPSKTSPIPNPSLLLPPSSSNSSSKTFEKLAHTSLAKKFYESVFNWKFPHKADHNGKSYDEEHIAMFETPGQPCPGGSISLVTKAEFVPSTRNGGVVLYLYVADLEGWEEVCLDYILLLSRRGLMRVNVFVLLCWDIHR